jgi:uncharacterized glyoxalase superfamily protein PhnB
MAKAKRPVPEGYHTVTISMTIDDCRKAIDWYKQALGAEERAVSLGPDGKVMHAEFKIGDTILMANDPMMGSKGPRGHDGSPASLYLYVADCDALFERAVRAGGQVMMPMTDQFWGDRSGTFTDPFGYVWTIATNKEELTMEEVEARAYFASTPKPQ